jgi:hypothetical protein
MKRLVLLAVAVLTLPGCADTPASPDAELVIAAAPRPWIRGRVPLCQEHSGRYRTVWIRPDSKQEATHLAHGDVPGMCPDDCGSPAQIAPGQGPVGTDFTITDPCWRLQEGDLVLFYPQGDDPATGTLGEGIAVPNPQTLNGTVPISLVSGVLYYVAVRPTRTSPSRFPDMPFQVT